MATCLFSLPLEMREKIYSELLVVAIPIAFEPGDGTLYRPVGSRRRGLYPAILRVNKKAYREASRLLYSKNRFEIPNATDSPKFPETASVALFLSQIGYQASLIRYICIDFPRWDFDQPEGGSSHPGDIRNLELVRSSCQNLRVLELSLGTGQDLIFYEPVTAEILDSIDVATKDVLLRKEIMVHIQVYDEDDIQDSVTMMRTHGWTVEVTKREPVKEIWEYGEYGMEFDNEDDFWDYVNMIEKGREEKERKEKELLEDYWEQIYDPWRRNDSDYD